MSRQGKATPLLTAEAVRFVRIERRLRAGSANFQQLRLCVEGVSDATLKRDLQAMRNEFDAPITWDSRYLVYRLESDWRGMGAFLQNHVRTA